jgi:RNA polymerase sigma-70 factor (ECF subfamily)
VTEDVERLPDRPEEDPEVSDIPLAALQKMIQGLPDGYRTVFNLYVFEQMPHRQIASLLGIKENSSASQLLRAKALLAREIKEYRKKNDR